MAHEQAIAHEYLLEQRRRLETQVTQLESTSATNAVLLKNLKRQLEFVELKINSPMVAAEIEAAEQAAFENRFDEFSS